MKKILAGILSKLPFAKNKSKSSSKDFDEGEQVLSAEPIPTRASEPVPATAGAESTVVAKEIDAATKVGPATVAVPVVDPVASEAAEEPSPLVSSGVENTESVPSTPLAVSRKRLSFSELSGASRTLAFLLLGVMGGALFTIGGAIYWLKLQVSPSHSTEHIAENHEETPEHAEDGHGEESVISQAAISKSILKRQDGKMEEDNDLRDPEPEGGRGLASLLKKDLEVQVGYRFVEIPGIHSGTRLGSSEDGEIMATIVLQIDTLEGERELIEKKTEIQALIANIFGETDKSKLRVDPGGEYLFKLKTEILRQANHLVSKGEVSDVLISAFTIK